MLNNFKQRAENYSLFLKSYFDRTLVHRDDLEWLFILTFPNGGSTALARIMLTAGCAVSLNDNVEGQWLVPSMCKGVARWNREHRISYRYVKAVWLGRLKGREPEGTTLVIEKSPSNMCRYRNMLRAFGSMKTYLVTLTRDPYATCSSWNQRYGYERILKIWDPTGRDFVSNEEDYYFFLGKIWLDRARMLLDARKDSCLDLSYEEFCDNPGIVAERMASVVPCLSDINAHAEIRVKDYEVQKIVNMNERQAGLLTDVQREAISKALCADRKTVESLGYVIL